MKLTFKDYQRAADLVLAYVPKPGDDTDYAALAHDLIREGLSEKGLTSSR